jgi:RHS repeat-associated protein
VERYEYTPYGETTIYTATASGGGDGDWWDGDEETTVVSTLGNSYLFTGREYDHESGLYYFRSRMWSPQAGRFMQRDPIGYRDGMNLYNGYFVPEGVDPEGKNRYIIEETAGLNHHMVCYDICEEWCNPDTGKKELISTGKMKCYGLVSNSGSIAVAGSGMGGGYVHTIEGTWDDIQSQPYGQPQDTRFKPIKTVYSTCEQDRSAMAALDSMTGDAPSSPAPTWSVVYNCHDFANQVVEWYVQPSPASKQGEAHASPPTP